MKKSQKKIKQIAFSNVFSKSKYKIQYINQELLKWRENLKITSQDYYSIEYNSNDKEDLNYVSTLPINKNAKEVQIEIAANINSDKTFYIEGTTNLFSNAQLLLSVCKNEQIICQAKTIVENGKFISPRFSNHGKGFRSGKYELNITLSFPNLQAKKFIDLAGTNYENLTGDFIKREGIAPHGKMSFIFEII